MVEGRISRVELGRGWRVDGGGWRVESGRSGPGNIKKSQYSILY